MSTALPQAQLVQHHGRPVASTHLGAMQLVDGHVHMHQCFQWDSFLAAAQRNFGEASRQLGLASGICGCLLFTESHGTSRFAELRSGQEIDGWTIHATDENCSVVCQSNAGHVIAIVAGRQIVTREGLEVLAIACDHKFVDGQPVVGIIPQINALGGFPILPWGFGKWRLRRGRVMRRLICNHQSGEIAVGDNGGRARFSRRPRMFKKAERKGIVVLPGSDPLPFRGELPRVGSYGFLHEGQLDARAPGATLVRSLRMMTKSPRCYGHRAHVLRFVGCQLAMQWRKRVRREN